MNLAYELAQKVNRAEFELREARIARKARGEVYGECQHELDCERDLDEARESMRVETEETAK